MFNNEFMYLDRQMDSQSDDAMERMMEDCWTTPDDDELSLRLTKLSNHLKFIADLQDIVRIGEVMDAERVWEWELVGIEDETENKIYIS